MLRLDKFLCEMKTGTRSQVKALVKKGAVTVNGITAKSPEQKIDENSDCICVNGSEVSYRKYVYSCSISLPDMSAQPGIIMTKQFWI